jgi:hypothetical protein
MAKGTSKKAKEAQAVVKFLEYYELHMNEMGRSAVPAIVKKTVNGEGVKVGYRIPKADSPIMEGFMGDVLAEGLLKSIGKRVKRVLLGNTQYDDFVVNGDSFQLDPTNYGKDITFAEIKEFIFQEVDEKRKGKMEALIEIKSLERKIKSRLDNQTVAADGAGNIFHFESADGLKMGVRFGSATEYDTVNEFAVVKRMFHNGHFKQSMEEVEAPTKFIQSFLGRKSKGGIQRFLEMYTDELLYDNRPEGLGLFDKIMQSMVNITAYRMLSLNPKAAIFNLAAGFSQSYVHNGLIVTSRGFGRLFSKFGVNADYDKAFVHGKGIDLMRNLGFVTTSTDAELSVTKEHAARVTNGLFATITVPEYINASFTIFGLMTDAEWNSYDEKGQVIEGREDTALTPERKSELLNQLRLLNGAYHPLNKRGVNRYAFGRILMQFKNWAPDFFSSHFSSKYTDMHDIEQGGFALSAMKNIGEVFQALVDKDGKKVKDVIDNMDEFEKRSWGKLMRELTLISISMLLYFNANDDDEEERADIFKRLLGDISYVYNPDTLIQLLGSGLPAIATTKDLLDLIMSIPGAIMGLESAKYQRATKYAKEGDLKMWIQFADLAPGRTLIKQAMKQD